MPRRYITTEAWVDDQFIALSANAKLLFVRLVTGPETGAAGALRLTATRAGKIAPDIPLDTDQFTSALEELTAPDERNNQMVRRYDDDWIWLPEFINHQVSGQGMIAAARRQAREVPDSLARAIDRALNAKFPTTKSGQDRDKATTRKPGNTKGNTQAAHQPDDSLSPGYAQPSREELEVLQEVQQEALSSGERASATDSPTETPPAPTSAGAESGGSPVPHDPDAAATAALLAADQALRDQPPPPPPDWAAIGGTIADAHERTTLAALQPRTDTHLPPDPEDRRHHVEATLNGNGKTCRYCHTPWTGLGTICDTCIDNEADRPTAARTSPEGTT